MNKKKTPAYQIQIIPNDSRSIHTFSIAKWFFRLFLLIGLLVVLGGFILTIYSSDIALQLSKTNQLEKTNRKLQKENNLLRKTLEKSSEIQSKHQNFIELARIFKLKKRNIDLLNEKSEMNLVENQEIENYISHLKESYLDSTDARNPIPNIQPVIGIISKTFSPENKHLGIDIAAMLNDPVYSTAPGIVMYSGWKKDLGKTIILDHGQGYTTKYAHLNKLLAKRGDYVDRGQFIGMIGMTGNTTGPHLHYEVIKDKEQVDPEKYFETDLGLEIN